MPSFRFRAQVALDLRRKQDEEAQRALGAARQARVAAEGTLEAEERALADGNLRASIEEARAWDASRTVWYRNWMRRQQQVIAAARAVVEARRQDERAAAERAMDARRRVRALERLRDRAWQVFLTAERRTERKEFDVLGGLRYVARRAVPEGV
jgi:flagellar biosynthesis chaperone FliJ